MNLRQGTRSPRGGKTPLPFPNLTRASPACAALVGGAPSLCPCVSGCYRMAETRAQGAPRLAPGPEGETPSDGIS
jgi:hypothetical protein